VVFLTDGFIGNEAEFWRSAAGLEHRGCSFNVSTSVSRHLLEGLARQSRRSDLRRQGDSATDVMDRFYRVNFPAMTDVKLDWGGMQVSEMYPKSVPDLFVGRPVVLTGRFEGKLPAEIRVSGQAANEPVTFSLPVRSGATKHSGLAGVWARHKIADLSDQALLRSSRSLLNEIRQVALDYGLLSDFTAFVAVDSIVKKEAGISVD
jgi:Ca-activated chloride channel family protein